MNMKLITAGASALSLVVGGVAGYFIARGKSKRYWHAFAESEIADVKEYYSMMHKTGEFETPEGAVKALARRRPELSLMPQVEGAQTEVGRAKTWETLERFVGAIKEARYVPPDAEDPEETGSGVVRVDFDEFQTNESGYEEHTFTYYGGDAILADPEDNGYDLSVIGNGTHIPFLKENGEMYIRNDLRSLMIEVIWNDLKYAEAVGLGK